MKSLQRDTNLLGHFLKIIAKSCEKKHAQKNTMLFALWYFQLLSYGHSDQTCSDL